MIYSEDAENVKEGEFLLMTAKIVRKEVLPDGRIHLVLEGDPADEYVYLITVGPKRTLEMSTHEFVFG